MDDHKGQVCARACSRKIRSIYFIGFSINMKLTLQTKPDQTKPDRNETNISIKMGLKYLVLFTLIIAFPLAQAQLGGIFGPGGIFGSILSLFRIQGVVYCTPNGNVGVNGTSTPVFPSKFSTYHFLHFLISSVPFQLVWFMILIKHANWHEIEPDII